MLWYQPPLSSLTEHIAALFRSDPCVHYKTRCFSYARGYMLSAFLCRRQRVTRDAFCAEQILTEIDHKWPTKCKCGAFADYPNYLHLIVAESIRYELLGGRRS